MVEDLVDPRRTEPEFLLTERVMLESWLEFHRSTLELKSEGLSDLQRKSRPVPTSRLSLHGLIRHMAEVERNWFRRVLAQEDIGFIWVDPTREDSDLVPLDDAIPALSSRHGRRDLTRSSASIRRRRGALPARQAAARGSD